MNLNCLTQKVELNYIIPAVRKQFIAFLEKKGFNDSEIARRLKITKSAISQYKHKKRGKTINFPRSIAEEIKKSSKAIGKGKNANVEILKIINEIKKSHYICLICKECECK